MPTHLLPYHHGTDWHKQMRGRLKITSLYFFFTKIIAKFFSKNIDRKGNLFHFLPDFPIRMAIRHQSEKNSIDVIFHSLFPLIAL